MARATSKDGNSDGRGWRRELLSITITLALLLVGRASFADHYRVPTGSMEPSVRAGDRVVVNKAAYGLRLPFTDAWLSDVRTPQRGDVVVVTSPEDGRVLLKRVVAVGGDCVTVRTGQITLNDERVPITTIAAPGQPAEALVRYSYETLDAGMHALKVGSGGPDFGPVTVPAGQLLLMGDNRGNSHDSRSFGFVRKEALLGRAVGVYVRAGRWRWIAL
ncbi:MAG TPA: signal peptidase I [Sorangium sp.]|nr:signal peptidase I [Sorangium sp.]